MNLPSAPISFTVVAMFFSGLPFSSTLLVTPLTDRSIDRAASRVPVRKITESSAQAIRITSTTGDIPRAPLRMLRMAALPSRWCLGS